MWYSRRRLGLEAEEEEAGTEGWLGKKETQTRCGEIRAAWPRLELECNGVKLGLIGQGVCNWDLGGS